MCLFYFSVQSRVQPLLFLNEMQYSSELDVCVSPDDQRLLLGLREFRPLRTLPLCTLNSHFHFTSFLPRLSLWWPGKRLRQRKFSTKTTVLFRLQQMKSYNLCSYILLKILQRSLYIQRYSKISSAKCGLYNLSILIK